MLNAAIRRARDAVTLERRVQERFDVTLRTALFDQGEIGAPVTLINLSASGFLARSGQRHAIGRTIQIYLPGLGPVDCITRWSGNGLLGCEFAQMIEAEDFSALLVIIGQTAPH